MNTDPEGVKQPKSGSSDESPPIASIWYLSSHYRSGVDDLQQDFFRPCLSACVKYRRGVGYFTSDALASWAEALPNVLRLPPGSVLLLMAPLLAKKDKEALQAAMGPEREAILQRKADDIVLEACGLKEAESGSSSDLLAWLVAKEITEIRFAFPTHIAAAGLYHEKIGVFDFPEGHQVAFTGSANETRGGHETNYESLDVFRSWVPGDEGRVETKIVQFDEAWSGLASGLRVLRLSSSALELVRTYVVGFEGRPGEPPPEEPSPPDSRWRHQDEAIETFLSRQRGVLEMATGTGKTRVALRIISTLLSTEEIDSVVIAADGNDLLDQWVSELLPLAVSVDPPLTLLKHYGPYHDTDRFVDNPQRAMMLTSRQNLPGVLRPISDHQNLLLVHDEVHKLGSPGSRQALHGLSDQIIWRLGLSATPDREYDDEGTAFILDHIGEVIFEFDLAEAIKRKVLCRFGYKAIHYEPDDQDRERIAKVHRMRAARTAEGKPMTDAEFWTELARVHKTSEAKLPPFERFVRNHPEILTRCIIFVETKNYGEKVLPIVHSVHPEFHTYFDHDQKDVLKRFARGDLECLVTCHRLSEGIDIRNLRNVILFSSARARLETIQRMGRCLRWDPEDPGKEAVVVDFVRSSTEGEENTDTQRADWLSGLSAVTAEERDD